MGRLRTASYLPSWPLAIERPERHQVACRADEIRGARNVITADRGDEPATEEGDAAVAIEFDGWAVVR